MATILLAGIDVADVDLDDGHGDGGYGIVDGDAGVAVAPSIEDDAVGGETHLMEAVDEFALDVALVVANLHIGELLPKVVYHFFHGGMSIDGGLTFACEVQIGAVDNLYSFHWD